VEEMEGRYSYIFVWLWSDVWNKIFQKTKSKSGVQIIVSKLCAFYKGMLMGRIIVSKQMFYDLISKSNIQLLRPRPSGEQKYLKILTDASFIKVFNELINFF
jgi:hypothetical protein